MKRSAGLFFGVILLASCGKKPTPAPLPPPVTFAVAEAQDVPYTISTFGNCVTIADVTLQAQVNGTLLKYTVAEGAMVKQGDVIAQIDPGPYQAALKEAQGDLDSARADLANMQVTLQRDQEMYKTKTISLADLQTAEANQLDAQGKVQTAEGQVADAQINLGYCTIASPINGKTGIYEVDAGNLVSANTTKLINVQTIDPIYVDFTISENDFDTVRQYFASGELQVEATIPGAKDKKIIGKLSFINNSIASQTGTLNLRATFPNADFLLWPGLFVNVRLILATLRNAVVVPAQCVMVGQPGPYVFAVGADNKVTMVPVALGQQQGDITVIVKGVKAGDKIVTAGQLGLVTGMAVKPSAWQAPAEALPSPTPSPAAK